MEKPTTMNVASNLKDNMTSTKPQENDDNLTSIVRECQAIEICYKCKIFGKRDINVAKR